MTGVRVQTRTIEVGGGDASGHAGSMHVGLGATERGEIRVRWPDGEWIPTYRRSPTRSWWSTAPSRRRHPGARGGGSLREGDSGRSKDTVGTAGELAGEGRWLLAAAVNGVRHKIDVVILS
jgi:hypothetical protein